LQENHHALKKHCALLSCAATAPAMQSPLLLWRNPTSRKRRRDAVEEEVERTKKLKREEPSLLQWRAYVSPHVRSVFSVQQSNITQLAIDALPEKEGCYMWYVCPTSKPGNTDRNKVFVNKHEQVQLLNLCFSQGSSQWGEFMQQVVKKGFNFIGDDEGRAKCFVNEWRNVREYNSTFKDYYDALKQKFNRLEVLPQSILEGRTDNDVIMDPAGTPYMNGTSALSNAGGLSKKLYDTFHITHVPEFYDRKKIKTSWARLVTYPHKCTIVHVIGPNFNNVMRAENDQEALSNAYNNAIMQFNQNATEGSTFRMCLLSTGHFAGRKSREELAMLLNNALEYALNNNNLTNGKRLQLYVKTTTGDDKFYVRELSGLCY